MLKLEEAVVRILEAIPAPKRQSVALNAADRRVLLDRLTAPIDLPPFDNSGMDGYAVRAADVALARPETPVCLHLSGRVPAGENFSGDLAPGSCIRLFTGSPLPGGADAVVMQEDTRLDPASPEAVWILEQARPWENVRLRGEDIKAGTTLMEAGTILNPGQLSLLAATGLGEVVVGAQPVIGLLATGSELKEAGERLGPGQIYESNRAGLGALIARAGGCPVVLPLVQDNRAATRAALDAALAQCDAVVTCGGVSVGEMDFVKRALADAGGELEFWKVAIKPGRPFVFGRCAGKFLFGLPGNPVSALVTFLFLVRPALLRWQGASEVNLPGHPGVLAEALSNSGERPHFLRVVVDASGKVSSAGVQAAHVLSSLAASNGLVEAPPGVTLPAGAGVHVLLWG